MSELSQAQRDALEYARQKILEQYKMRKAPDVATLEGIARACVAHYISEARHHGVTIEPIEVHIEHHGGGHYAMVPVVYEPIHSITISVAK